MNLTLAHPVALVHPRTLGRCTKPGGLGEAVLEIGLVLGGIALALVIAVVRSRSDRL